MKLLPSVFNRSHRRVPANAIYVGRPTKFGNPFIMYFEKDRNAVVDQFEEWIHRDLEPQRALRAAARRELRGKHLVCWCAPKKCHADVWLRIANRRILTS